MPRPDLKNERREQILLAFERCVARFGMEGATLERTAKEAGLARALIRHNVGNKDDLIAEMTERFFVASSAQWSDLEKALPAENPATALVGQLFEPRGDNAHSVLLTEALISHAAQDKALAKRMRDWLDASLDLICNAVRQELSTIDAAQAEAIAAGILGTYFNVNSLAMIGNTDRLRGASKKAALMLLDGYG